MPPFDLNQRAKRLTGKVAPPELIPRLIERERIANWRDGETDMAGKYEGGCTCGQVRYRVTAAPMIVHCCHCRWCQRQSGSAFALNALIEADRVEVIAGQVEEVLTASPSGKGQIIARCPNCRIAVWSNYDMGGLKDRIRFIRVGTLDDPDHMPPDIHIYAGSMQPWVRLPEGAKVVAEYYSMKEIWSPESQARFAVLREAARSGAS